MRLFVPFIFFLAPLFLLQAQDHTEDGDHHHDSVVHLGPIDVMGQLESSTILNTVPTVSNLHGRELLKKSKNSLGETLNGEVGVSSSQFGPASSRPIIRGLEGDRIRILQNGIGILDASGTSQDHAVPTNPLAAESVEIVRGPINLLYGSSAIGGVVNIVTSRIHKDFYEGFFGGLDLKSESVNQGKNISTKMDYGVGPVMLHLDGNYLQAENTDTPLGEIQNSETEQHSIAFGATFFTKSKNYLGLSYSTFQNIYGVVSEADVDITLKQQRIDLAGYYQLNGFLKAIQLKSAQTFYEHTEFESGSPGTVFDNEGNETRIELIQKTVGNLSGLIGVQSQSVKLSALGDEAFLPSSNQTNQALFVFEELKLRSWKFNAGLRGEFTNLKTDGTGFFANSLEKDYTTYSAALGAIYSISKTLSTTLNLSSNERAPNHQEVFAQGPHLAVGIYEQGDPTLGKEKSLAVEWSLRHQSKRSSTMLTVFNQNFTDYIALNPTGSFDDTDESGTAGDSSDDFEIYNYATTKAQIRGLELDFRYNVFPGFNARFMADYLHGTNKSTDQPLPRISPIRVSIGLDYSFARWSTNLDWKNVFKQTRTAPNETETPSYNLVNYGLDYKLTLADESLLRIYFQVNNIGDVKARNHVSVIKNQVLLPGRNFVMGVRLLF